MSPPRRARTSAAQGATSAALWLLSALFASHALGCALAVPKSWRVGAPVPLHGPVSANDTEGGDWSSLSTEELARTVAADHRRLTEIAADKGGEGIAERRLEELREIALRLPALQRELDARNAQDASEPATIR